MSYISKFKFDTAYSNADIAEALTLLTGQGITPTTPNEILSNYANGGITYADGQLKVTVSGNTATVAAGSAIMTDGSYIIVYSPVSFAIDNTGTYYLYLKEVNTGDIKIICETTAPTTDFSYINLATITNGVAADSRTFANAKINFTSGLTTQTETVTTYTYSVETITPLKSDWKFVRMIALDGDYTGHTAIYDRERNYTLQEGSAREGTWYFNTTVLSNGNIEVSYNKRTGNPGTTIFAVSIY